jgi:hypothetical protein
MAATESTGMAPPGNSMLPLGSRKAELLTLAHMIAIFRITSATYSVGTPMPARADEIFAISSVLAILFDTTLTGILKSSSTENRPYGLAGFLLISGTGSRVGLPISKEMFWRFEL